MGGSAGAAGGGRGPSSAATSSYGSHSLSAPTPDRWREGGNWCQGAVTAGGQSWGRVLCGQGLYGEGAAAGGLAAGPPWSPLPREPWLGPQGVMDAVGQESGQGVSPHPPPGASHALVPVAAETATPLSSIPGCQQDLPPKDTSCPPLTGYRAGWGLWGPALSCGQGGRGQGECGHQEVFVMMGGLEGLRAGGACPYICRARAHSLSHPKWPPSPLHAKGPLAFSPASDTCTGLGRPGLGSVWHL